MHHIQTVSVKRRETEQLGHTLDKHTHHQQRHAANPLLHTPPIDQHARRDHQPHEEHATAEPVLGDTMATAFPDPALDDVVGVAPTDEGAEDVAETWGEVEEGREERGGEVETGVEDVADRGEEGVPGRSQ